MELKTNALAITCYCGLSRLLDPLEDGDLLILPPCPRCGASIKGTYTDGKIVTDAYEV